MKDTRVRFVVFTIFAIQSATMVKALTMSETCRYVSGFIANPDDCRGWGWCNNGTLEDFGQCPNGLSFDVSNGICNVPESSECRSSLAQRCNTDGNATLFLHPENCDSFCICHNGEPICGSCPSGQVFHSGECVFADSPDYPGCLATSICRLVPNGVFAEDPENCGHFILCNVGVVVNSGPCTNGNFNPVTGFCDTSHDTCTHRPDDIIPDISHISCTTQGDFLSDERTCHGFVYCVSNTEGIWGTCPRGLHFDGTNCVSPASYACLYDRCANMDVAFMAKADTNCKSYVRCQNGQQVGSPENCPESHINFNEVRQGCVSYSLADQRICT